MKSCGSLFFDFLIPAFMASDPGLKSRFNRFINFEDYSLRSWFRVFHLFANKAQYRISTAAADKLRGIFEVAFENRDGQFGKAILCGVCLNARSSSSPAVS